MFSGGDHVRYTIRTEPIGWVVERKNKEFTRLQTALDKLYPGILVFRDNNYNLRE